MKLLLIGIVVLISLVAAVVAVTLMKNQAQFSQPPGFMPRLTVYLGEHTAATSDNHAFPELITPVFYTGADRLFGVVMAAADDLGWQVQESDDENLKAHFVITSSIFSFEDDLKVQVLLKNAQFNSEESALAIHSISRKGTADFAANAGHIQALVQQVGQRLGSRR